MTGGCSPGGGASGDWSRLAAGAGSARDGAGFWIGWGDVGGAGLGPWPGGRIGAEGGTESSRHSQTPRAGSSRRGVNAAGAWVVAGAWAVAGAWVVAGAGAGG